VTDLARLVLDELRADPAALAELRELVGNLDTDPVMSAPAYTPRTLAAELGRSERSIRGAIARGELAAVKRGRGWVIGADAVQAWASAPPPARGRAPRVSRPARNSGKGPMARALARPG
jgi:excisionase family DNA binding protein